MTAPLTPPDCDIRRRVIVPNVIEFVAKASEMRGRLAAERFEQEMLNQIEDVGLESPIEDLFWVAITLMCEAYYHPLNPEPRFTDAAERVESWGLFVSPQARVGSYRVDFLVRGKVTFDDIRPIVVELDGHVFHERDQRERSREKARDRFLVAHGYRVVHFTGSDVVRDPFKCAHEVLELAGLLESLSHETGYDPGNPLGLES